MSIYRAVLYCGPVYCAGQGGLKFESEDKGTKCELLTRFLPFLEMESKNFG